MSLERKSQVNCIIRIIRESLDKLRISLILPQIFENLIIVRKRLQGTGYEKCIDMIKEYIQEKVKQNNE